MKTYTTLVILLSAIFIAFPHVGHSAIIVTDDFNDGVFDTSKWTATLPFSESSFAETGGQLTLNNRAIISAAMVIGAPTEVSGRMKASQFDIVRFVTRSSLASMDPVYHEIDGIHFTYNFGSSVIAIEDYLVGTIAVKPFSFAADQWYDFSITDDGTNVTLSINGIQELAGTSAYSSGSDLVAFYNREVNRGWAIPSSANFDSITITGVPEPTGVGLLLAGVFGIGCFRSRSIRARINL